FSVLIISEPLRPKASSFSILILKKSISPFGLKNVISIPSSDSLNEYPNSFSSSITYTFSSSINSKPLSKEGHTGSPPIPSFSYPFVTSHFPPISSSSVITLLQPHKISNNNIAQQSFFTVLFIHYFSSSK